MCQTGDGRAIMEFCTSDRVNKALNFKGVGLGLGA